MCCALKMSKKHGKFPNIKDSFVLSDDILEEEYVPVIEKRKTSPYMSQYELSALILARVLQLSSPSGSPLIPMSEIDNFDPLVIATKEVYARLPPLVIRRTLNDGSTEDWLLTDKNNVLEFPRM